MSGWGGGGCCRGQSEAVKSLSFFRQLSSFVDRGWTRDQSSLKPESQILPEGEELIQLL